MAYHSKLWSPSGAGRWVNCPGAYRMLQLLQEMKIPFAEIDWSSANEGTIAHDIAEKLIYNEEIGDVNPEILENVQSYVDGIKMHDFFLLEQRVDFSNYIHQEDATGTADCILINDDTIEIRDFKYGFVKVYAKQNEQLMLYALGTLQTFDIEHKITEIKFTIWQPRVRHYSEWYCDMETLLAFGRKARKSARQVNASLKTKTYEEVEPFLHVGLKQCTYCPVAAMCPKLYEHLAEIKEENLVENFG